MSSRHVDGAVSEYREFRRTQAFAKYLLCIWTQTIRSRVEFEQRVGFKTYSVGDVEIVWWSVQVIND